MKKHPNILLFAIDSILADHMSCYGYPRLTTPHLDKFATQGTLFEKTYSAHIPTTPAYSSMLTGRDCFGTEVVALRHKGDLRFRPGGCGELPKVGQLVGGQTVRGYASRAANLTRSQDARQAAAERRQIEEAEKIVDVLGHMEGVAMKVGQMVSVIDLEGGCRADSAGAEVGCSARSFFEARAPGQVRRGASCARARCIAQGKGRP